MERRSLSFEWHGPYTDSFPRLKKKRQNQSYRTISKFLNESKRVINSVINAGKIYLHFLFLKKFIDVLSQRQEFISCNVLN